MFSGAFVLLDLQEENQKLQDGSQEKSDKENVLNKVRYVTDF